MTGLELASTTATMERTVAKMENCIFFFCSGVSVDNEKRKGSSFVSSDWRKTRGYIGERIDGGGMWGGMGCDGKGPW